MDEKYLALVKGGMSVGKIIIPYLQIGDFKVETPVGLAELLQNAWARPKENDPVDKFVSKYHRTVFRNPEGRLVTKYEKVGDNNEHQSK